MLNYKQVQNKYINFDDIRQYYTNGAKPVCEHKFGLEYERISIDKTTLKTAHFDNLVKIIKTFAQVMDWEILFDNNTIIGATNNKSSISLEPGGQMELSLEAQENILEIESKSKELLKTLDRIANFYNIDFLPCGLTPKSVHNNIEIVKKERYEIMAKTLKKSGKFAPIMMRETAGVQLNIDYENEKDAIQKIKLLSLISPFITGFFANSPIRNNKLTNYKSFRALAWKYTGKKRCGVFYKNIIDKENATFDDYINAILDVPMVFAQKEGRKVQLFERINFREYMKENAVTLEDYILHSSLCFPDVRLKNCIEIRNHDSQDFKTTLCICAFYKGILSSDFSEIFKDLNNINAKDIDSMGFLASRYGTDFEYKNISAKKYIKRLFKIARENLNEDEKKYLDVANKYLEKEICIADGILENKITNSNELYKYLKG